MTYHALFPLTLDNDSTPEPSSIFFLYFVSPTQNSLKKNEYILFPSSLIKIILSQFPKKATSFHKEAAYILSNEYKRIFATKETKFFIVSKISWLL